MLTEFNLHYNDISPNHFTTCVAFRLIVLLMSIVVRPVLAFIFSFIHTKETLCIYWSFLFYFMLGQYSSWNSFREPRPRPESLCHGS